MIIGLHHAQITIPVGAEQQGRDFYCGQLGLDEIEKPQPLRERGGFWLRVGDRNVHVGVENDFDRTLAKAQLAYEVSDLSYWRDHLSNLGIPIIEGIEIPGFIRFEFRDPFGNRVEMIQAI